MPQVFKAYGMLVFIWSDENNPLEPIHVHITNGVPEKNSTKVWITKNGKCILAHNKSKINEHILNKVMKIIEARHMDIENQWYKIFDEISYYC